MAEQWTGAEWRKSSRSGNQGNCVEVADNLPTIGVRDSKDPLGPVLGFAPVTWRNFVQGVGAGTLKSSLPRT